MPLYDYLCVSCNKEWENFHSIKDRDSELCKCGKKAQQVMRPSKTGDISYNYYDNALGMQITSPEQRKKEIKKAGLFEL